MIRLSAFQNKDGCSSISRGRPCPWGYSCAQRHPFDLCITMQIQWVILVWIFFSAPISVAGIDERWVHQQFFRIFDSFCLLLFSFSLNLLLYEEYYFCRGDFHWERFNKREYFEVLRGLSDVISGVSSASVPFFVELIFVLLLSTCKSCRNSHSLWSSKEDVHSLENHHQKLQCQLCHLFLCASVILIQLPSVSFVQKHFEMGLITNFLPVGTWQNNWNSISS